jgi:hypothetical protein
MYKKSIRENREYLIPFVEGIKYYGSDEIENAIGTMMILNDHGDVLTCRHIAERFIENDRLSTRYKEIVDKLNGANNKERRKIEKEYDLHDDSIVLTNINLPFEVNSNLNLEITLHNFLDLAIIRFKGLKTKLNHYPVFSKSLPEQGQSVCKIGYAFPEYSLFEYSNKLNNIVIKKEIVPSFPIFPLDGIVTRMIMDERNCLSMFETSSPGLRGQSGGPIFSPEGLVYGIQCLTKHLDLNFDVNLVVRRGYYGKEVNHTPFINLGVGVASTEIIKFLKDNKIDFECK